MPVGTREPGPGGGEVFAEFSDRGGVPVGGHRVQADDQFPLGAGVDVPGVGEDLAGQGVGVINGAGGAGMEPDAPGDGGGSSPV